MANYRLRVPRIDSLARIIGVVIEPGEVLIRPPKNSHMEHLPRAQPKEFKSGRGGRSEVSRRHANFHSHLGCPKLFEAEWIRMLWQIL